MPGEFGLLVFMKIQKSPLSPVLPTGIDGLDNILGGGLPSESQLQSEAQSTMYHPSKVEMDASLRKIGSVIDERKPARVVIDALSELQLLADTPLRYRRQVRAPKQFFGSRACTVMLLRDRTAAGVDLQARSIAHGVITLEQTVKDYGSERRRVRVVKSRSRAFRGGMHDYTVQSGGLRVFPRLVAAELRVIAQRDQLCSGIDALDNLLGGGLEEGSSTLIAGPPVTGKSSLSSNFVAAAARRGQPCAMLLFEEATSNLLNRADGLGMPVRAHHARVLLTIQQIDPAALSPGEFAAAVCKSVDDGARVDRTTEAP